MNFEVAKIEEKKSNALNHVAFWVVICEVLKSKLKMLFTSFEKNDLFVHCLMHLFSYAQWVGIL